MLYNGPLGSKLQKQKSTTILVVVLNLLCHTEGLELTVECRKGVCLEDNLIGHALHTGQSVGAVNVAERSMLEPSQEGLEPKSACSSTEKTNSIRLS